MKKAEERKRPKRVTSLRPMLAASVEDVSQLRFPLIGSPKIDGIRCLILNGLAWTRNLKAIPNRFIRNALRSLPNGLDGELVAGSFAQTSSAVMSHEGDPVFCYYVFDLVDAERSYLARLERLDALSPKLTEGFCRVLGWEPLDDLADLERYEEWCLENGFEGICLRRPDAPYKHGRSTFASHDLLKLKRFEDSEARIVGTVERFHNDNPAEIDELGRPKRSRKRAGLIPTGALGALCVIDVRSGTAFEVGSGFTEVQRRELWRVRKKLVGRLIRYRSQPSGAQERPRFPVFEGFRDQRDLDDDAVTS